MHDADAAYAAGAALNSLDNLVRQDFSWAGAWRQRLALQSAATAVNLTGRREDESALRDTNYLRATGDDPGPAGHILMAWRRLAGRTTRCDEEVVRPLAEQHLGLQWDEGLAEVIANAEDMAASSRPAPVLAAEIALRGKLYDVVSIAGGWAFRTRTAYADAIATSAAVPDRAVDLTQNEAMVLVSIAYHQPVTRGGVSEILGREVSRDVIGALRDKNMITGGPRSPTAGAPFTYVTTKEFLEHFGLHTLRDLPDLEAMQDAGWLTDGGQVEASGQLHESTANIADIEMFSVERV